MTPENQTIAIADACDVKPTPDGWMVYHPKRETIMLSSWVKEDCERWIEQHPEFENEGWIVRRSEHYPQYLNDLNAIVPVIRMLSPTQRVLFVRTLQDVYSNGSTPLATPEDALIFASPAHYSESYLRTIGKWHD